MNNNANPNQRAYVPVPMPMHPNQRAPPAGNFNLPPQRVRIPLPAGPVPPAVANIHPGNDNDDDDEEGGEALIIRITAQTTVIGNNNICSVNSADITERVSASIASAISRMGGDVPGGIPMIDGNGDPRRIEVTVDVSTRVHGEGNLVGDQEVVARMGQGAAPEGIQAMLNDGGAFQGIDGGQEAEADLGGDVNGHREEVEVAAVPPPQQPKKRKVIVKREPVDDVNAINETPSLPDLGDVDATPKNMRDRIHLDVASEAAVSPVADNVAKGTPKGTPKPGSKRKSARIARDDEVASNIGLGIDREAQDHATKKARRG